MAQDGGERAESALQGLKIISAGRKVDYNGASGPCDFNEVGDITDAKFRYEQVKGGAIKLLKIA